MGKITLPIAEIFYSLQGEGMLAGAPSTFVRLAGCPIRCSWCDTRDAWEVRETQRLTVDRIVERLEKYPTKHVVLTGGEPLMHPKVKTLTDLLIESGCHVTVETSGFFDRKISCQLLSLSPKIFKEGSFKPAVLRRLISQSRDYQIKFVIEKVTEVERVCELIKVHSWIDHDRVMLMPKAGTAKRYEAVAPKVAGWALERNLRFCPRLHLQLKIK